jgi:hypothetical protein
LKYKKRPGEKGGKFKGKRQKGERKMKQGERK